MNFFKTLMFDCVKKENRDWVGWWKIQAGLVVLMWLHILIVILTIAGAACDS